MKRKASRRHERRGKVRAAQPPRTTSISILPMEIQIGDRFTDEEGEWVVMSHAAALHGAKSLRARVRRAEQPVDERDVTWPAHVRIEIQRGPSRQ